MDTKKRIFLIAIIGITVIVTYLHYSAVPNIQSLHDIYRAFYYIPVLLAAIMFGLKGAIFSYIFVLVLYVPFIYQSWTGNLLFEADRLLHLALQGLFAILAGFLIDRDRRNREVIGKERYLAGIGLMASNIVHDLKNPIITILGFAKRIQEGKGQADAALREIIDSATTMQKIVHDVLDFAKPPQLELKSEDVRNVIERACNSCRTKAEELGVTISTRFPSNPVVLAVDSFHLKRAIGNLLTNAIEASPRGQKVTIDALQGKDYFVIRIKDQGVGMNSETLENIFMPFYTRKSGGSGLGMPIAKKIIDGHRGNILIKSLPRKGTEVIVRLPLNKV